LFKSVFRVKLGGSGTVKLWFSKKQHNKNNKKLGDIRKSQHQKHKKELFVKEMSTNVRKSAPEYVSAS